eukprot:2605780-Rhodomonas_salina.1
MAECSRRLSRCCIAFRPNTARQCRWLFSLLTWLAESEIGVAVAAGFWRQGRRMTLGDATKGNKPGRESSALCLGAWSGADAASGAVLGASRRMDDVLLRVQA